MANRVGGVGSEGIIHLMAHGQGSLLIYNQIYTSPKICKMVEMHSFGSTQFLEQNARAIPLL
jgi:hypothetical protein